MQETLFQALPVIGFIATAAISTPSLGGTTRKLERPTAGMVPQNLFQIWHQSHKQTVQFPIIRRSVRKPLKTLDGR
jgi:hypothetical protein